MPHQDSHDVTLPSMDPVIALTRLGGVARAAALHRHASRHAVAKAVTAGYIVHPYPGVYALPDTPAAIIAAAHLRGHVSHVSAAALWGLDVLTEPDHHHITVPHNRRHRPTAATAIHYARLKPCDVDLVDGRCPVTSLARTVIDCCRTLPLQDALVIGDSALRNPDRNRDRDRHGPRRHRLTLDDLATIGSGLRGPGSGRAQRAIRLLDPKAESVPESVFRALIHQAGFPPPVSQFVRLDGRIRIDFCWPQARIAVEIEGYEFHSTREAWRRDCRRNNELVGLGMNLYRFTWNDIMFDPDYVIHTLRRALIKAGVRV